MMMKSPYASNLDTILTLPSETNVVAIAQACREAALAFVTDSDRWGKAELAMWLMGPYQQLMRFDHQYVRRRADAVPPSAPLLREIDARMVERIIKNARAEIGESLAATRDPEMAASFLFTMLCAGYVVRCEDLAGGAGWIPATAASRLADRVLSLFAVDYLVRAADYENAHAICRSCGVVAFTPADAGCHCASGRGRLSVGDHRRTAQRHSLVVARRQSTLPYLPEGA